MKNILLVHGAWGGAWEFEEFIETLTKQGHETVAIDLPGHGQNPASLSEVTMEAYVNKVIETADTLDGPIVLIGHSLAGAIISLVGERIPEKIERLVYIAATLPRSGETVMGLMESDAGGELLPNIVFSEDQSYATVKPEDVKQFLLNDVHEEERLNYFVPKFDMKQATEPFLAPIELTDAAFGSIPKSYLRCTTDKVLSLELQDKMVTGWEVEEIFTLKSGHFPMMSIPDQFIEVVSKIVAGSPVPA